MVAGAATGFLGVTRKLVTEWKNLGMVSSKEIERLTLQFKPLLGSMGAAKKRAKELFEFGTKTPFEFPDVATGAKMLDEWKAAKRAEAMRRVGQILAMRERLRGLVADSPPAEILRNKITVALKRVKGDENLPASAHALLDNERVRAVIDPATGKAFVAGAIVERDSYRYVVQNVDPARSKVQIRYLNAGYGSEHWSDVSAAGASYTPTDMTDREAFDEALDNIAKSNKTFRAFENLSTFRPELIAENAETVSAALTRAFRSSEDKTDKAPMVTPSGEIVVMTSTQARERPDLRMVVPVGADWTRLVDAATEASRPEKARNLKWAESAVYMNPIIGSLGGVYGDKLRSDLLAAVRRRLA